MNTVRASVYESGHSGPHVLFLGAIHGNEICGPKAIQRLERELRTGAVRLVRGTVTCVRVCNPRAYAKNVRFTEQNLNRVFRKTKNPRSYEAHLANQLAPLIDACDIVLDLHSFTARGRPFIFIDFPSEKTRAHAKVLGPKMAVVGWPELYAKQTRAHASYDTTAYAARKGKIGLLIECGQHTAPEAERIAYVAMRRTLAHFRLTEGKASSGRLAFVKVDRVYFRTNVSQKLTRKWKHLDPVKKGTLVVQGGEGAGIKAPYDGYVILPKATGKVDEELVYFGRTS
ncbi:MAG TPA: succinylglutamate desuccinylase/aspartoacylase family protein [Candidatus Paceibacterota bacterium]